MSFDGFVSGAQPTPLPPALLLELLPQMRDPAELVVALYAIAAIARQRRYPRTIREADLRETRPLIEALASLCPDRDWEQSFQDGLSAAVERGVVLRGRSNVNGEWVTWLALNDVDGRRAMLEPQMHRPATVVEGRTESGGLAQLWESALGSPMPAILHEEVGRAAAKYGTELLHDAMLEAAANNVRTWRYVAAILDRWEREGRDERDSTTGAAASGLESSRYRHLFRE